MPLHGYNEMAGRPNSGDDRASIAAFSPRPGRRRLSAMNTNRPCPAFAFDLRRDAGRDLCGMPDHRWPIGAWLRAGAAAIARCARVRSDYRIGTLGKIGRDRSVPKNKTDSARV